MNTLDRLKYCERFALSGSFSPYDAVAGFSWLVARSQENSQPVMRSSYLAPLRVSESQNNVRTLSLLTLSKAFTYSVNRMRVYFWDSVPSSVVLA